MDGLTPGCRPELPEKAPKLDANPMGRKVGEREPLGFLQRQIEDGITPVSWTVSGLGRVAGSERQLGHRCSTFRSRRESDSLGPSAGVAGCRRLRCK